MADKKIDTRATAPGGGEDGAVRHLVRAAFRHGYGVGHEDADAWRRFRMDEAADEYIASNPGPLRLLTPTPQETVDELEEMLDRYEEAAHDAGGGWAGAGQRTRRIRNDIDALLARLPSPTVPADREPDGYVGMPDRRSWFVPGAEPPDADPTWVAVYFGTPPAPTVPEGVDEGVEALARRLEVIATWMRGVVGVESHPCRAWITKQDAATVAEAAARLRPSPPAGTEGLDVLCVGDIRAAIEGVPDDRVVVAQVVATNGDTWMMAPTFHAEVPRGRTALIRLTHPDVHSLPTPPEGHDGQHGRGDTGGL